MNELVKKIGEQPFRAMGLAFAVGLSLGMRGRPSKERGFMAAAFAGATALGLRYLKNVAIEQVIESLKQQVGLGGTPAASATQTDGVYH